MTTALVDMPNAKRQPKAEHSHMPEPRSYLRMSTGRKFAIRAMLESGLSQSKIAALEGISKSTVHDIAHDPEIAELDPKIVGKTKAMMAGRAYLFADRAISKAGEEDRMDKMNSYQLTVMGSIMIDKARLLDGLSTDNIALHNVSEQLQSGAREIESVKDMIIKRFKMIKSVDNIVDNSQKEC